MNHTLQVMKKWDGLDLSKHPANECLTALTPAEILNTNGGVAPLLIAGVAIDCATLGFAAGLAIAKWVSTWEF